MTSMTSLTSFLTLGLDCWAVSLARILGWVVFVLISASLLEWIRKGRVRQGRLITVMLLLLLSANGLALFPVTLPTLQSRLPAEGISTPNLSGLVGLVAGIPNTTAQSFDSYCSSLNWINFLEQEFGGFSIYSSVEKALDSDPRVLIVSSTKVRELGYGNSRHILEWVSSGRTLVVELPENVSFEITGIEMRREYPSIQRKSSVVSIRLDSELGTETVTLPWQASIAPVVRCADVSVVLEVDGHPAVVKRRVGNGSIISLLFDLSKQLMVFQQGLPAQNLKLRNTRGHPDVLDAPDLVCCNEMFNSTLPYADIVERLLCQLLEQDSPVPRPWYFPYPFDGVALMTHDEDWFGDRSIFVSRKEASQNYASTFFIIPAGPITKHGLEKMKALGTDIQIHWNRETRRWLVLFKKLDGSLRKQIQLTEEKTGKRPTLCRIERLRWGKCYTRPFQIMEAQGILLDSSYGPAGHRGKGYLFGTGLPFHPIDTNGLPFKIYELPILVQVRYGGANASFISLLMNQSRYRFHETINVLYHPADLVEGQPAREDWLQFSAIARQNNHALMTMYGFLEWWQARRSIIIKDVAWNGTRLGFRCVAPRDDCAVLVPLAFGGRTASSVETDSNHHPDTRVVTLEGKKYLLVHLGRGDQFASIRYG